MCRAPKLDESERDAHRRRRRRLRRRLDLCFADPPAPPLPLALGAGSERRSEKGGHLRLAQPPILATSTSSSAVTDLDIDCSNRPFSPAQNSLHPGRPYNPDRIGGWLRSSSRADAAGAEPGPECYGAASRHSRVLRRCAQSGIVCSQRNGGRYVGAGLSYIEVAQARLKNEDWPIARLQNANPPHLPMQKLENS